MSFQGLVSSSECGTSANPLAQVLKHTDGDRSLQQDRIAGPSSSRLHQLPTGPHQAAANEQDLALARQFFEAKAQEHGFGPGFSLHAPDLARLEGRPDLQEAWAKEQSLRSMEGSTANAAWASEFQAAPQLNGSGPSMQSNPMAMQVQSRNTYMPSMNVYTAPMGTGMYGGMGMQYGYNPGLQISDKGKGKSREADFEAAFAQVAESLSSQTQSKSEDDVERLEEVLKNATLEQKEELKAAWEDMQKSELPSNDDDIAKWESEFSQLMNAQRDELDYGESMQSAWESSIGGFQEGPSAEKPLLFDAEGVPQLGEYVFEKTNPYMDAPPRSLLDDAKALLEQNGSLSEAALMLEAAIQKGDLGEGGFEAWILLGETRNMDEREDAGMKALLEGVKRAEIRGTSGEGMMSLAISFTNESFDRGSHAMLLRWLRARYPSYPVPPETIEAMSTNSAWDTHGRITDVFLNLARDQHAQGGMDPDVQVGLGVLFYTNGEYDRAKDCFEAALSVRPRDYLLWNRLGSSLSNGNKPEEALGAYREALNLRPTYTRAIYNVGVACLNIGADKEAAEHFLSALSLQESTSGDTSDQLWFTLRRAFLSMQRNDLADMAKLEAKTNLDVFRREGFEF
ncbi:peroxisome targeting signal receptor [Coprinellus micaceus]|uniref:Peroxisome targeting signal receptor n=1 Tax=Coprinellus micaceus TaxID=71717 RepID=A0A4Y7T812_COPMI|nr:peroxisome targeting signal receptor [Coprinellus micaceus]